MESRIDGTNKASSREERISPGIRPASAAKPAKVANRHPAMKESMTIRRSDLSVLSVEPATTGKKSSGSLSLSSAGASWKSVVFSSHTRYIAKSASSIMMPGRDLKILILRRYSPPRSQLADMTMDTTERIQTETGIRNAANRRQIRCTVWWVFLLNMRILKKLKVQHIARNKNMLYFCRPQKWGFYFKKSLINKTLVQSEHLKLQDSFGQ